MSLSKFFLVTLSSASLLLASIMCCGLTLGLVSSLGWGWLGFLPSLNLLFYLDSISLTFLFMVTLVTSLVALFSEFYMDSYNNKKFLATTFLFFSFMSVLSISGDLYLFMLGWDGLGISSLFLIMIYPNKTTMYNSFLTLFFNRLGDVFLIMFFLVWLQNSELSYFLSSSIESLGYFILFLCLATKSAQIPFSSWLPAAMSAPTPISAMVHSSTLVTAGILVFFKTFSMIYVSGFSTPIVIVSSLTFLMGGVLAVCEKDMKKVVAFSTMSQISMIILFIGLSEFFLGVSHTFCHALFKSLLFCSCGILFFTMYSNQLSKFISSNSIIKSMISFMMIFSLFSMSGLIFSSSFFTKDAILEFISSEKSVILFFLLILGSVLTLAYSGIILKGLNSIEKGYVSVSNLKSFTSSFILLYSIISLVCFKLLSTFLLNYFSFIVEPSVVGSISGVLLLSLILWSFKPSSLFLSLSSSVFYMKDNFYSSLNWFMNSSTMNLTASDHMLFKPSSLIKMDELSLNWANFLLCLPFGIIILVYFSF